MTVLRELAGMELAATLTAEYAQFNVICVLHLRNGPTLVEIQSAFEKLRARHPLLRVRIVRSGRRHLLQNTDGPPVALAEVQRDNDQTWQQLAEEELNRPMDAAHEPLIRCTMVGAGESTGELVFSFHHSIADGACVLNLLHELLTLCSAAQDPGEPLPALEPQPSAVDLLPKSARGLRRIWRVAAFMGRQMADEIRFRMNNRHQRAPEIQPDHHTRILSLRLAEPVTSALARACRGRRTPLHSVLNAAFLLAVNSCLYGSEARLLRYMTFANLRPFLKPPVPVHHVGAYLAMLRHSAAITPGVDVWTLAGSINQQLLASARRGDKFTACLLSPKMMSTMLRHHPGRMTVTALAYAGPVPLEEQYGRIGVEGINGYVSNIDIGPEAAAQVRLFRGELWWDFLFLASELDIDESQGLAATVMELLEDAAQKGQEDASHH